MSFDLYYNVAANEFSFTRQSPYYGLIKEFRTDKDRESYINARVESSKVWVVFYNTAAGKGFVEDHGFGSGNFRGSLYGYYNNVGEYASKEAAEKALAVIGEK